MTSPIGSFDESKRYPLAINYAENPLTQSLVENGAYGENGSPMGSIPAYAPKDTFRPQSNTALGLISAAERGLGAASQVVPTENAGDAALQAVGAGLSGAASGAAIGSMVLPGPGTAVGAAVGGLVGIVGGGIGAYLGVKSSREKRRKQEAVIAAINAKEEKRMREERLAAADNLRFNRRQNALQSQWSAYLYAGKKLNEQLANNQEFRRQFIALGR